jgi:phosphatidylserine/phosphatidylglycerophosphate/cardiolipin synthase-like enzyme
LKQLLLILVLLTTIGCVHAEAGTEYCTDTINANQTAVYFPRHDQYVEPVIVDLFDKANNSIDVAMYAFDDPLIAKALVSAASKGIKVRVITDRWASQTKYQHLTLDELLFAHIPIKINSHADLMNLKMCIIDDTIATTGSYDFTLQDNQTNDEMFVVITEKKFVRICKDEFDRLWESDKGFVNYPQ